MSYSDLQLRNATQIAYADLQYGFDNLLIFGHQPPFTIRDIIKASPGFADLRSLKGLSPECLEWKIPGPPYDNNDKTGFYGCVIETGDHSAIVGFRGSEGMDDMGNVEKDWIGGDLDLLKRTLTAQQAEADNYMKQISESNYIDRYDNLALTGHSLGGNLADHAAIISYKYGLDTKISQEVSFDGPGFSEEYIKDHNDDIARMSGKMTHYKWSFVGTLLQELPGVPDITLAVKSSSDIFYLIALRHDTNSLTYDNDGNAIRGEEDLFSLLMDPFSEGLDHLPGPLCDLLVYGVGALLITCVWMKDRIFDKDGQLTPFGVTVVGGVIVFILGVGAITLISVAAFIITQMILVIVAVLIYEFLYDALDRIISQVCEFVGKAMNWAVDKITQLTFAVNQFVEGIKAWLNKNCNAGNRYSAANPYIKLNTYNLSRYAERLASVNNRINNLDGRLDNLYLKVGIENMGNIVIADLLTGTSYRICKCMNYLNDTAADFEIVERRLVGQISS